MQPSLSLLFWLAVFLTASSSLQSQVSFGVKGGVSFNTVNESPDLAATLRKENVTGTTAGLFFEFGGAGLLGLRPELLFRQKGYELDLDSLAATVKENFNYLDIPIVIRLHLGPQNFRLFAEGGASLGMVLKGVRTFTRNGQEQREDIETAEYDSEGRRIAPFDLGGILGAGIEAKLGPGKLFLNGRYNLDLNDFYQYEGDEPPGYEAIKWRTLDVLVGYGFTF